MRQPRDEEAPAETPGRGAPLSEGLPLQMTHRARGGQEYRNMSPTAKPRAGAIGAAERRSRRQQWLRRGSPARQTGSREGRQPRRPQPSARPGGCAASRAPEPSWGLDGPRGSLSDQRAYKRGSQQLRTAPTGRRPGSPDAGPEPEGGAPGQRGFTVPVRGRERKSGRGARGPGSPHGGAAGPPCAGTWTP